MWLASVSIRSRLTGKIVPTYRQTDEQRALAQQHLLTILSGVGDHDRERCFEMCITTCLHRAVTQAEADAMPEWWKNACAVDLAGAPIRILWHKGVKDTPSVQPCANPSKEYMGNPLDGLYALLDCGKCESCLARMARLVG